MFYTSVVIHLAFHLPKHTSLFLPLEGPLKQQGDQRPLPGSRSKLTNGKKSGIESNEGSAKQTGWLLQHIWWLLGRDPACRVHEVLLQNSLGRQVEACQKKFWNKNCSCRAFTVVELPLEVRLLMFLMGWKQHRDLGVTPLRETELSMWLSYRSAAWFTEMYREAQLDTFLP